MTRGIKASLIKPVVILCFAEKRHVDLRQSLNKLLCSTSYGKVVNVIFFMEPTDYYAEMQIEVIPTLVFIQDNREVARLSDTSNYETIQATLTRCLVGGTTGATA